MSVKLDILNAMLASIGSSGINSTAGRHPGLLRSEPILDRINRTIQARGHWFNTDWSLKLLPNAEGEYILPDGTLKADTTAKHEPYVRRGRRMYDPRANTFNLTAASVTLDIVISLDFDDLPVTASDLIQARAIWELVQSSDADALTLQGRKADVGVALMAFESERISQADYSLRDNPAYSRIMRGLKPLHTATRGSPTNIGG